MGCWVCWPASDTTAESGAGLRGVWVSTCSVAKALSKPEPLLSEGSRGLNWYTGAGESEREAAFETATLAGVIIGSRPEGEVMLGVLSTASGGAGAAGVSGDGQQGTDFPVLDEG